MALEGIGGVGAINVTSTSKVSRPQVSEVKFADAGVGSGNIQVEQIKPVQEKSGSNNSGNNPYQEDRAAVQAEGEISPEKVKSAVDDLNKQIKQASPLHKTALSFKYHDETNRISITVKDSDTDEIIREIPPEKALDMLAKAWEMAGLLVDEKR